MCRVLCTWAIEAAKQAEEENGIIIHVPSFEASCTAEPLEPFLLPFSKGIFTPLSSSMLSSFRHELDAVNPPAKPTARFAPEQNFKCVLKILNWINKIISQCFSAPSTVLVFLFQPRTLESKFTLRRLPCEQLALVCASSPARLYEKNLDQPKGQKVLQLTARLMMQKKDLNRFKVFNARWAAYSGSLEVFVCFRSLFRRTTAAKRCKIKSRCAGMKNRLFGQRLEAVALGVATRTSKSIKFRRRDLHRCLRRDRATFAALKVTLKINSLAAVRTCRNQFRCGTRHGRKRKRAGIHKSSFPICD